MKVPSLAMLAPQGHRFFCFGSQFAAGSTQVSRPLENGLAAAPPKLNHTRTVLGGDPPVGRSVLTAQKQIVCRCTHTVVCIVEKNVSSVSAHAISQRRPFTLSWRVQYCCLVWVKNLIVCDAWFNVCRVSCLPTLQVCTLCIRRKKSGELVVKTS